MKKKRKTNRCSSNLVRRKMKQILAVILVVLIVNGGIDYGYGGIVVTAMAENLNTINNPGENR